jgi:hypothetical protein
VCPNSFCGESTVIEESVEGVGEVIREGVGEAIIEGAGVEEVIREGAGVEV